METTHSEINSPQKVNIKLEGGWLNQLREEFQKQYMIDLKKFLQEEIEAGKIIYPHGKNIFESLNFTAWDNVKVVIIGQDPYHGPHQAHGLSFSVRKNIPTPPSLQNIFKELSQDIGCQIPKSGDLSGWAQQGVLLLNSILTVQKSSPLSHQNKGWEIFTDKIVQLINQEKKGVVFFLWGSPAQQKGKNIDEKNHLVIKAPHPSPLSAHRGFFHQKYFSRANQYLESQGKTPIDWTNLSY
jgi:uracil-DNA glycosylase